MKNCARFIRPVLLVLYLGIPFFLLAQTGPGGVGKTDGTSSLRYWVSADQNVTGTAPVTAWGDLSGYNITNSIIGTPQLVTGSLNGYPVVKFDGSQHIVTSLSINANTYPNLTVIAVYTPRIDNSGGVWGEDNGGWDRFIFDEGGGFNNLVSEGTGSLSNIPNIFPIGAPVITSIIYQDGVTNGGTVNADGQTEATFTSHQAGQSSNNFQLATIGTNYYFDGNIAELMVFGTNVNAAQRIIIDNYLSAKYNIPLSSGKIYTQADPANGDYDFEVAGIGRIDASNMQTDAAGSGMMEILNPSNLTDDEFLFWGHDAGAAVANNTTDVPAGVQARLGRVWRVSERNTAGTASVDIGNVDIRFNLTGAVTASDLRLLIDANNNGQFSDETPIGGATSVGGNMYQFSAVPGTSLTDNSRFTLGTVNTTTTSLPLQLLSFHAVASGNSVLLSWVTGEEQNSAYFDVERSVNGTSWKSLGEVKAAGQSTETRNYVFTDASMPATIAYYRLKEVDLDSRMVYSGVQVVDTHQAGQLEVWPNPAQGVVYVKMAAAGEMLVGLYNMAGQNVLGSRMVGGVGDGFFAIELGTVPKGTYLLKTTGAVRTVIKN